MVGEERTNFILTNSIYLVVAGSDDLANTYFTIGIRRLQYNVNSYTDLMVRGASNFVKVLISLSILLYMIFMGFYLFIYLSAQERNLVIFGNKFYKD